MKHIFFITLVVLGIASFATAFYRRGIESEKPVIYWVTDQNPARLQQVAEFDRWLKANQYPEMELRLDTANNDVSKKLIQGVSGVAGDIMDVLSDDTMPYLAEVGILMDVTEAARRMGFGPEKTYSSVKPGLTFRGKQYAFPCNVSPSMLVVNREAFRNVGMSPPPSDWDFDTFERIGREYVKRANGESPRERLFFCGAAISETILRRSYGLDVFNETLTRCTLDDPRNARMLEKVRQWAEVDRLIPTAGDIASFSGEAGYGGIDVQLFQRGNYAMLSSGRHFIIQARAATGRDLAVSAPPHAEFPNTTIIARVAGIYRGSRQPALAEYFLKFLASPEYSRLIVDDGDSLPPLPEAALTAEFRQPAGHPNEWDFHKPFAEAAETIAIAPSVSPYVSPFLVKRLEKDYSDAFKARLLGAEESGSLAAREINREIARTIQEHAGLRASYEKDAALQEQIDGLKAGGGKIPAKWIKNPFHLKYYRDNGRLEEDTQ